MKWTKLDIGGLEDTKRICGITVAERKGKLGKADKVCSKPLHALSLFSAILLLKCFSSMMY